MKETLAVQVHSLLLEAVARHKRSSWYSYYNGASSILAKSQQTTSLGSILKVPLSA